MAQIEAAVTAVNGIVWGPAMLILILGTGLYLMVGLGFMPLRRLPAAFRLMFQGRRAGTDEKGEITPFQSLMTALAATIGTGNIAGVATAIALGGPGAVFWMWMTALVGMATKYGEAVLAIRYREVDAEAIEVIRDHEIGIAAGHRTGRGAGILALHPDRRVVAGPGHQDAVVIRVGLPRA